MRPAGVIPSQPWGLPLLQAGSSLCVRHGAAGNSACHVEDGAPLGEGENQRTTPPPAAGFKPPPSEPRASAYARR